MSPLLVCVTGLVVGGLIVRFHGLNFVFNSYYHSNRLLYDRITPETFELLNRLSGFGIMALSAAFLVCLLLSGQKTDTFFSDHYHTILLIMLCLTGSLIIYSAFHKYFHNDEIEHIHSAWYVKHAFVPYRDFFQHHNPLLWYLTLPVLYLFGESLGALLAARFIMVLLLFGISGLTYLISATIAKSRETGLIAVALLFSSITFAEKAIEIRPDVPQVLFGLLSVYLLIRFVDYRQERYLVLSGLSAAISFLFLQKAVFLLLAFLVAFILGCVKRLFRPRDALYFACGLLPPLVLFVAALALGGALEDYWITNVALNLHHFGSDQLSPRLLDPLLATIGERFWLIAAGAVPVILLFRDRKAPFSLWIPLVAGLSEIASLGLFAHRYKHFYLFTIVLFCIVGSCCLARMLDFLKAGKTARTALFALLLFMAVPFLIINSLHSNRPQFEKMQYVLDVTRDTDLVHDGVNTFNLFRRDLHYFWYQLGVGLSTYNRATGNRYGDYDVCRLVRQKRPKVISGVRLDMDRCMLWTLYDPTRYTFTYIRRDEPSRTGR